MKLYLASSLCFVSDIILDKEDLKGKRVGCIRNGAKQRGGKDAWRNKRDQEFFESNGAIIVDIDIEVLDKKGLGDILNTIDVLFVGGGDTKFLANYIYEHEENFLDLIINRVKGGLTYMGTSAGAMLACEVLHYRDGSNQRLEGLGLFECNIIPHRNQPGHKKYWVNQIDDIYSLERPTILLNDISVIVSDGKTYSVQISDKHTLKEVFEIKNTGKL